MRSRERVERALAHQEPDRVPLDLSGCGQSGMHVDTVYLLRQALGLDEPGTPVKVIEPYQLLGEIKDDLADALGVDVVGLNMPVNMFGFRSQGWKAWTTFGGTPVLVPGDFNTDVDQHGDLYLYAGGDKSYPPSAKMPRGGYYFDSLKRQYPIDDDHLNLEDNLEEFGPIPDKDLEYLHRESIRLFEQTNRAIMMVFPGSGLGDIALVPGPMLKDPKGIRDVEEWYVSTITRRDFIYQIFERQTDIVMHNLERMYQAVGDRVTVVETSGTDFGTQNSAFLSPDSFRSLYLPHYKRVNDWIHAFTGWKTFIHSCGAVKSLIPLFIEAGFDVLNPVQTSATDMDPQTLKTEFGDRLTFWGGGIDTQRVLPFGTPDEVRQQTRQRMSIFGPGGGFVFNPIHNVQAKTPIENLLAMYETVRDYGKYPLNDRD